MIIKLFMQLCQYISSFTNIELKYVNLVFYSAFVLLIGTILKLIGGEVLKVITDGQQRYIANQKYKRFINFLEGFALFFVWDEYIKSLMTLISFVSAATAIALRDIIFNWFCGIYIKIKKLFKVEDRIEVDNVKGDVMNISTLSFELLEVSNEENGQSTGVSITFPNSIVFTKPIKNYTKGFKYIWNETVIKIDLDADLEKNKQQIYNIINSIEEIQRVPKKTKNQISNISGNYRIYYNKYEPIIYTKVVDNHIELTLRYLMNPKKARYVESIIWDKILDAYNKKLINLYKES